MFDRRLIRTRRQTTSLEFRLDQCATDSAFTEVGAKVCRNQDHRFWNVWKKYRTFQGGRRARHKEPGNASCWPISVAPVVHLVTTSEVSRRWCRPGSSRSKTDLPRSCRLLPAYLSGRPSRAFTSGPVQLGTNPTPERLDILRRPASAGVLCYTEARGNRILKIDARRQHRLG